MTLAQNIDIVIFERFLLSVLKEELSEFYRERTGNNKKFEKNISGMRPDFNYEDWEEIYAKYKNTEIEEAKEIMHKLIIEQSLKIQEQGET